MPGHKVSIAAPVQSGNFSFLWSWQARPAMIIIHLPLEGRPRFGGAEPTPPGRRWASIAQMYILRACRGNP